MGLAQRVFQSVRLHPSALLQLEEPLPNCPYSLRSILLSQNPINFKDDFSKILPNLQRRDNAEGNPSRCASPRGRREGGQRARKPTHLSAPETVRGASSPPSPSSPSPSCPSPSCPSPPDPIPARSPPRPIPSPSCPSQPDPIPARSHSRRGSGAERPAGGAMRPAMEKAAGGSAGAWAACPGA